MKKVYTYEEKQELFFLALRQKICFWLNENKLFSISSLKVLNTVGPILHCFNTLDIIASKEIFLFTCDISVARGVCFPGEEKGFFPKPIR